MGQADVGHVVGLGCALTSELILLFLYIGYMALTAAALLIEVVLVRRRLVDTRRILRRELTADRDDQH